jgi:hypothetical protein
MAPKNSGRPGVDEALCFEVEQASDVAVLEDQLRNAERARDVSEVGDHADEGDQLATEGDGQ